MTWRERVFGRAVWLTLPDDLDLSNMAPGIRRLTENIQRHGMLLQHKPAWARRRRLRRVWETHILPRLLRGQL